MSPRKQRTWPVLAAILAVLAVASGCRSRAEGQSGPDLNTVRGSDARTDDDMDHRDALVSTPAAFGRLMTFPIGFLATGVVASDFNLDGNPDVAVSFSRGLNVLLGVGDGSLQSAALYDAGLLPSGIGAADLDRDGSPDLVVANLLGAGPKLQNLAFLYGRPSGSFEPATLVTAGLGSEGIVLNDLNGDGWPDIATANRYGDSLGVEIGTGQRTFRAPIIYPVGREPRSVVVGDFDGDGVPDLAAVNSGSNTLSILRGGANATFGVAVTVPVGRVPGGAATGDLDGDQVTDIVVANSSDNSLSVVFGGGAGSMRSAKIAVGKSPLALAVADVNRDAVVDLIVCNGYDHAVGVLFGLGGARFEVMVSFDVGGIPAAVVVADLNRDGRADLVVATQDATLSVLLGQSR